jgi:DNA mismatch repair protein MutH
MHNRNLSEATMTRITIKEAFDVLTKSYEAGDFENFCKSDINKGLTGLLLEKALGIPASGANIDCSDGEIKTFQVKKLACGTLKTDQTIAVSMVDICHVKEHDFDNSKYAEKLETVLFVPKWKESNGLASFGRPKLVCLAKEYPILWQRIRDDYNMIRDMMIQGETISGSNGIILQSRTKGPGHGSTSRAFYLLPHFLPELFTGMKGTTLTKRTPERKIWWDKYKEQKTNEQTKTGCAA